MKPVSLTFFLSALVLATTARAQGTDASAKAAAEALFKQGRALVAAGKYAEACPKLAESQRLDPAAGTLLNLGDCFEKNGQTASAWATFADAARAADERRRPEWRTIAESRIKALQPLLPMLVVEVEGSPEDVKLARDGIDLGRAQWGAPIPVDPGPHEIVATAPGKQTWRGSVVAKPSEKVALRVPKLAATPASPSDATKAIAAEPAPTRSPTLRTLGVVALAAGGAGVVVGAITGVMAANEKSKVDSLCPGSPCSDTTGLAANDRAHTDATVATIGFVAGGALLGAGAALLFFSAEGPRRTSVSVVPTAGGLEGRF